jgi:ferredoxin-NADP reductase
VWAARTGVELFASAELRAMERERPRFHFVSLRSREADGEGRRGRLDRAQLEAVVAAARAEEVADGAGLTEYFVCGPPGFLRDIPRALRRLGVPRRRLHVERFGL